MSALTSPRQRRRLALVAASGIPVETRALDKSFGPLVVLRQASVTFHPGRTTALIGPNAAGKTTLLKCILGLVRPDSGVIMVGEHVAGAGEAYRRLIGYMPQSASFPEHLTVGEVTRMIRDLRGSEGIPDNELLQRFELARFHDSAVRTLSGGTRQKLNAALAFMFRPQVLILDEPTAGLDPIAAGILKEKVAQARDAGATIIITSHVIAELEELSDDVVLLLDGAVCYQGPLGRISRETGEARLERAVAALMRPTGRQP